MPVVIVPKEANKKKKKKREKKRKEEKRRGKREERGEKNSCERQILVDREKDGEISFRYRDTDCEQGF